jgi:small ligand-binding sensory domain FIST
MIDVAIVVASSLYDEPSRIVPLLLGAVKHLGAKGEGGGRRCYDGVRHVVGNTAGGVIGSIVRDGSGGEDGSGGTLACDARESEGAPALSVTFALLPDVEIRTFRLAGGRDCNAPSFDPRPDGIEGWRRDVGLGGFARDDDDDDIDERDARDANEDGDGGGPIFMVVPSPAYQNDIDEFMYGLRCAFPHGKIFGGIASTVSSLSRARVFAYSEKEAASIGGVGRGGGITSSISYSYTSSSIPEHSSYGDGCVGLAMYGDVRVDTMIAQGAKPVGGVYRVVATGRGGRSSSTKTGSRSSRSSPRSRSSSMSRGDDYDEEEGSDNDDDQASRSTIGAIVLDEAATVEESEAEEGGYDNDDKDDDDGSMNVDNDDGGDGMSEMEKRAAKRTRLMADYAKARIPKPPLAEANFVMKKLSDDDQAFMRRALLIGLERGGNGVGRTPGELARLARGEGHRFTVRQVASAGMKDGSVTFPLGSVNVKVGARCRFFVRDGEFARKEVC